MHPWVFRVQVYSCSNGEPNPFQGEILRNSENTLREFKNFLPQNCWANFKQMGEGNFVQINSNLKAYVLNDLNCFLILAMWPKGLLFKEMIHFRFMTLWPHPGSPGGHETYNFSRILISHHINIILKFTVIYAWDKWRFW